MSIYSNKAQLEEIAHYLSAYMKIPFFQDDTIPGKVMEKIISLVRGAKQLGTYDYVDVCIDNEVGWQVKSTKNSTPVTWKRAKIANAQQLIKESKNSKRGCKKLGDAIIEFCNNHAKESVKRYNLSEIGYSRLIMFPDNVAIYFERLICTASKPEIFNANDFIWHWSVQKKATKKEQLPALHGISKGTGRKVFAWHGKGENQLHFSGEGEWWPQISMPTKVGVIDISRDGHAMAFKLPSSKVNWGSLVSYLLEES